MLILCRRDDRYMIDEIEHARSVIGFTHRYRGRGVAIPSLAAYSRLAIVAARRL